MSRNEARFTSAVIELAERLRWRVFHLPDGAHNKRLNPTAVGFPDLVLVRGPVVLFAELKVPPNKLTQQQEEWRQALCDANMDVVIWTPADWPEHIQSVLSYP